MYVNIDINSVVKPFLDRVTKEDDVKREDLYPFVDVYRGSFVTDLLFDIFCQYSATDSKYWNSYSDKYEQEYENGIAVDYKKEYKSIYKLNKEFGLDPYLVWINRCHDVGLNAWISVRMNDCHGSDERAYFLRSDFFYEAKKKGMLLGEDYGYFCSTYNYRYEAVRNKMLDYIEEQLLRYDVYGIELDFMREIYCFDYLKDNMKECTEIMNGFMRSVREKVKKAQAKHGHDIKIAVRLNRDIEQSLFYGFDARTWDREKLADIIIPTPRWSNSDGDMPIDVWKKELSNTTVLAGLESLVTNKGGIKEATAEITRGLAAKYLSDGADGIYLYNYFVDPGSTSEDAKRNKTVFNTCGDLEEIRKHPMRYAVIEQEDSVCPPGFERYNPLPIELSEKESTISLKTMDIPSGKTVSLILGFCNGNPENAKVCVNGKGLEKSEPIQIDKIDGMPPQSVNYAPDGAVCRRYPLNSSPSDSRFDISISSVESGITVCWAEIDII